MTLRFCFVWHANYCESSSNLLPRGFLNTLFLLWHLRGLNPKDNPFFVRWCVKMAWNVKPYIKVCYLCENPLHKFHILYCRRGSLGWTTFFLEESLVSWWRSETWRGLTTYQLKCEQPRLCRASLPWQGSQDTSGVLISMVNYYKRCRATYPPRALSQQTVMGWATVR